MNRAVCTSLTAVLAVALVVPVGAKPSRQTVQERLLASRLARVTDNVVSAGALSPIHRPASPASIQFGLDVQVNPVNDNPARPHNEFAIAGNPRNPRNLITGSNDYSTDGTSYTGAYYSTDGGATWSGGNLPCNLPPSGTNCPQGDPGVDFDGRGVAWFVTLCFGGAADDVGGICVLNSTDGGMTWGNAQYIAQNTDIIFYDRESIAVDKRRTGPLAGRIYITATKFNDIDGPIVLLYSDDGVTWTENQVTPDTCCYQAANPKVGDNGILYIGYESYTDYCNDDIHLKIVRSETGGQSFGPPIDISGGPVVAAGLIEPGCANTTRQVLLAEPTHTEFRHRTFPVLAVAGRNDERVYAVWSDGRWGSAYSWTDPDTAINYSGHHSDIAFSGSTDNGLTWTPARKINNDYDGSRDQFFPWIAIGPGNVLSITYLDRRAEYEPNNEYLYNKSYQFSANGGRNWSLTRRVSDESSDPAHVLFSSGKSAFLGDYEQLYASPRSVVATWLDTRVGTPDLQQNQFSDHLQQMP